MAVSRHGAVNGWCRVTGIPLKAADCPDCLASTVRLHREGDGDYTVEVAGVAHHVMREHDGNAPSCYRWSVRRGSWAQHDEVANVVTLHEVRLWVARQRQAAAR